VLSITVHCTSYCHLSNRAALLWIASRWSASLVEDRC